MLKEMIESPSSRPLELKLATFEIGISCIDINATDEDGFTLLMLATIDPYPLYVKLLLAKESLEVNLANNDGHSALAFLSAHTPFSDRLVHHFLERQAAFKDVDFSNIDDDIPLLLNTIQENRLDYAGLLLDCSTYHASPSELVTVRDILVLGKRVLLFNPKEDSADKKMGLLKLLHKVETKERHEERRRQGAT